MGHDWNYLTRSRALRVLGLLERQKKPVETGLTAPPSRVDAPTLYIDRGLKVTFLTRSATRTSALSFPMA
ncbi:MAG: hypothetical protein LBT38_12410 [Deltaproteobacteria bacterium]|nr:hypothetical protein [Deltaproteobacteria bacterium]